MSGYRPLTSRERAALVQHPCDGVPRFGTRSTIHRVSYSRAYQAILAEENCTTSKDGVSFTHRGASRIKALNRLYTTFAKDFLEIAAWKASQRQAVVET